jgi:dihydroneopterin aldolase
LGEAGKSDDLSKTINYADVAALIHKRIIGEPVNLLERLAQLIAEDIINNFDINEVEVTVHKPQAPIPLPFTDVSVSIKRKR